MLEPAAAGTKRALLRVAAGWWRSASRASSSASRWRWAASGLSASQPALSPELLAVQHRCRTRRSTVSTSSPAPRALVGTVTAADEVFVFADGLFASSAHATELLEAGQAVLVQPVESGLAAGSNGSTLSQAAAGAMRLPGRLIEQLADLPIDCDAVSRAAADRAAGRSARSANCLRMSGEGAVLDTGAQRR